MHPSVHDPDEITFTSCGTESDSTAIRAAIESNPGKKHIITTRVEHPAVKNLCEHFSKNGYRVTFVPVDSMGNLDLDYFNRLTDDTAIASIMWANNESGIIFPIDEISKIVKEKKLSFTRMRFRPLGKSRLTFPKCTGLTCFHYPGTKFTRPKESVRSM